MIDMNTVSRWTIFFLLFFLLPIYVLHAQVVTPIAKPVINAANQSEITLATIQKKIDAITNKTNLEEALKQRILAAYYAAEANIEELLNLEQEIQTAQNLIKNLPSEIKQLEQRIGETEDQLKNQQEEKFLDHPVDDLEQRLIIEKSNLNELNSSISRLEIQIAEQLKSQQQIREKIAETNNRLANTQQERAALNTQSLNKLEIKALKAQLDSRFNKLNATLNKLSLENIVYPLSLESQRLELQLLNLQSKQLSASIIHMDDFLIEKRQQDIEKERAALIQAQKEASGKHPVIQEATRESIRYNQLLKEITQKLEQYQDQKHEIEARYKELEDDFQSAEQKINLAGLSPSLGNLLREQRRNLPLTKGTQNLIDSLQEEVALANLEQFKLDEVKKSLADIDKALQSKMSLHVQGDIDEAEKFNISVELRGLLNNQKELVQKLTSVYSEYARTVIDVNYSLQQLVTLGEKFDLYLNERLLWVPSAPVINKQYAGEILDSILWFSKQSHWQQLAVDIKHSVQAKPLLALLGFFIISLLLGFRQAINIRLQDLLKKARKPYADRFIFTFYGLGYVFLLVLPLFLLLAWPGWLLLINNQVATFSHLVADGLLRAAIPLLIISFFYQLFKPEGFVQTLFGWQEHSIQLLHGQLKRVRIIVIPAMFLVGIFADGIYAEHSYTLGRMALIIILLALAYVLHRFAHPVTGLGKDFYRENPTSWVCRLRYIWYFALVFAPLTIIGFAIAGYYQSALELQYKLVLLLRLIFFAVLLHEVVMRWLVLANRQLALQNARQKRKLQEQAEGKTGASTINPEEEFLLDIPQINQQSEKLLNVLIIIILAVGYWLILRDMLPAFSIFEKVVLWQHMAIIDGQESLQPITLVNIFFSLLYLALMLIFIKNFSSLIDLFLVGRFRMTSGSRYALIHLTRYAVIIITFIAVASELGGKWSEVQWLVAAISVGLGFGLQEIFANMVSGIILLFERPIRVGDTVTVGEVTGKVSRIQIRATTLVDWDQKELIVPNKIFITEKLINWTLSDTMTRVVIPVGIAYGSDEEQALRIFKQVIEESSLILKDPKPSVFFVGFGESSMDFTLRVFVQDMDDRFLVADELHRRILHEFRAHNIEIPFPQRDLHIRSSVLSSGNI